MILFGRNVASLSGRGFGADGDVDHASLNEIGARAANEPEGETVFGEADAEAEGLWEDAEAEWEDEELVCCTKFWL